MRQIQHLTEPSNLTLWTPHLQSCGRWMNVDRTMIILDTQSLGRWAKFLTVLYTLTFDLMRVDCLDEVENTHRCPNPDNTFSRRLTASMNAGTFSGLETSNDEIELCWPLSNDCSRSLADGNQHTDDSLVSATYQVTSSYMQWRKGVAQPWRGPLRRVTVLAHYLRLFLIAH